MAASELLRHHSDVVHKPLANRARRVDRVACGRVRDGERERTRSGSGDDMRRHDRVRTWSGEMELGARDAGGGDAPNV